MADDILKNIPLPADLPENWTSGQIVAPTGAEAGLDEQHGYELPDEASQQRAEGGKGAE